MKKILQVFMHISKLEVCVKLKKESGIAHLLEHIITDSWDKCKGNCTSYWSKKGIYIMLRLLLFILDTYIVGVQRN